MKRNKYIFLIFSLLFATYACDNDLDLMPYGVPTVDGFYNTAEDALLAVNSCYRPARVLGDGFNSDMGMGDHGTDDVFKGGSSASDQGSLFQKESYTLVASNSLLEARWKSCYQGIMYCNTVLEEVTEIEMDDALKTKYLGEAFFMRAYYYFNLVKYFGGVPKIDHVLAPNEYVMEKSTQEEIYSFIEADFIEASKRLPKKSEYDAQNKGRADKGAALGMLVRVSIYQNKMDKVKEYSEDLFALNEYTLAPSVNSIFQPEGELGSGSIFEICYFSTGEIGWLVGQGNTTASAYGPRVNVTGGKGGWGFGQVKQGLIDEFEPEDPRKDATIYNPDDYNDEDITQPYGPGIFNRKYSSTPFSNYPIAATGWGSNEPHNFRVLRLADVYLMYAEAVYSTDPATAREYVNKVRTRSTMPELDNTLTGQDLLDAIYHERRVELAMEGIRFFDLVRTGRAVSVLGSMGFVAGKHELMPIPTSEILITDGVLKQNPNYN